jgi:hypothetical protein
VAAGAITYSLTARPTSHAGTDSYAGGRGAQPPRSHLALESGAFRPLIDRRYRLEEIVEAYRHVETGQKIGNVVVGVEPLRS